ncbi:MAG: hypothetical protein AB2704_26045 [Candidatus Thiodiazotropha taylori]
MLPSELPQLEDYPNLKYVLANQVDMLFVDLRCLLKAPLPGCTSGFNLSIASLLLNIISGFSRRLYRPANSKKDGDRFKDMLVSYFPWENPNLMPMDGAELLYHSLRNPLTHELGIKGRDKVVVSTNGILTDCDIQELENSEVKPPYISCPVTHLNLYKNYFEWHVSVPSMYWATHRLLHNLINDHVNSQATEKRMKKLLLKVSSK